MSEPWAGEQKIFKTEKGGGTNKNISSSFEGNSVKLELEKNK